MPRAEQPGSKASEGSTCEHRAAAKGEHEPILWRAKVTRALLQQVREHTLMSWNNETLTLPYYIMTKVMSTFTQMLDRKTGLTNSK